MLNLSEIKKEFDTGLTGINALRSMIKEYIQCKTLEFIYQGPFKDRMVFIGGTKLRLFNNFRIFLKTWISIYRGNTIAMTTLLCVNIWLNNLKNRTLKQKLIGISK